MIRDSIYKSTYERKDRRLHKGFDYKDKIMNKTLSSRMFGVNRTLTLFIKAMNDTVYNWIESVKMIKTHANPHIDKYDNKIN